MNRFLCTSLVLAASVALAVPAMAQPVGDLGAPVVASQPVPDTSREAPGIPGSEAVNPAPGAHGPYVGAGRQAFYDIDQRIALMTRQIQIQSLPGVQRRSATAQLRQIEAEETTQKARHSELRDWDRESLNGKLDKLTRQFPSLQANGGDQAPPPAQ